MLYQRSVFLRALATLSASIALLAIPPAVSAAPLISRLTPPSELFKSGRLDPPTSHDSFLAKASIFKPPSSQTRGRRSLYLHRTQGKALGIVTTADVFDATPAAMAVHTANRGAGTGINDQYLDDRHLTGLTVLMGGGRKWFLPNPSNSISPQPPNGSQRRAANDYVLPTELATAWNASPGKLDPERDLINDFQAAGFTYVVNNTELQQIAPKTDKLLGLFTFSNMNIATDVDRRMLIGYAANADRFEDWLTNELPLQDSQQPFVGQPPLNLYPANPLHRDEAGGFLVTGQIEDVVAAHTANDIPLSALGASASLFTGVMDNSDVFFKIMQAIRLK